MILITISHPLLLGRRWLWVGTILIQDSAVGFRVWTLILNRFIFCFDLTSLQWPSNVQFYYVFMTYGIDSL